MRSTFVVGQVRGTVRRVLWLAPADARVFPGPWRVTAVVTDDTPEAPFPGLDAAPAAVAKPATVTKPVTGPTPVPEGTGATTPPRLPADGEQLTLL